MAARFAVTTGNWSGAIWAATSGGAAGSAAVPTAADDATINKNVVVTIDDTTAVCLSLTLSVGTTGADVGGQYVPSQSANSKITIQNGITSSGASGGSGSYSSYFNADMSGAAGFTHEVVLNNSATGSAGFGASLNGNFTIKGAARKRHTVLNGAISSGATSCTVADATGWRVGDKLIFATTGAVSNPPKTDEITIGTVDTGTGAVTWTGGTTYDHANNCPVGNFSSNLIIRPGAAGNIAFCTIGAAAANMSIAGYVTDVEFRSQAAGSTFGNAPLSLNTSTSGDIVSCSNNAFYDYRSACLFLRSLNSVITRQNNIFYTSSNVQATSGQDTNGTATIGPDEDYVVFRSGTTAVVFGAIYPGQHQRRHKISGCAVNAGANVATVFSSRPGVRWEDCDLWSCASGFGTLGILDATNCRFGSKVFSGCDNTSNLVTGDGALTVTDCEFPATLGRLGALSTLPDAQVRVVNRDGDSAIQEIYGSHSNTVPIIQRVIDTINRSTSAVLMTCNAATAIEHSFEVLAKAGETIRIIGFVMKSGTPAYGASTLPKITISGLGITPVVATMAGGTAADTWEQLTLNATNSGASDGLLTVTFTAQSATAGAKAWFSGIPVAPFVSRCRHYGYTFDETNPVRATNITVSASEATAAAYTGMAVTWGASSSSVAVTTSNTLQKLYDYTQAQGCLNVGMAMPLTGAGVAGSPALFAAGNITVSDGAVLNGSGSLSMGSKTLSTEFASGVNYTFTGGTWGQLSDSPTFAGGTLSIGAAATYTFATTGAIIINMTPTAPSTYAMASVTATGQIDLRNTTAHAITVELSSAAAALAITTNNTGGAITIRAPQVYQQVPITNITTTSRLQIYDISAVAPAGSRELYNGVPGATSYTWTDPLPAVAARDIRVRIADVTGVTAKEFIESSIGTCGITEGTKSVSYRASQVADTTYNTNAVDGSLVTGITFTDAATDLVNVNLTGGNTTWPNIYAAFAYWISTAAGIDDDIAYVDAVDPANYLLTSMKVKNTTSPSVALTITGGFGRSATTGSIVDIIDTTGGFIFPLVDHVVVATVGSGPLTATQDAKLMGLPSATTTASATLAAAATTPIAANIKQVNSLAVDGAGTESDPWGPV